MYRPSGQPGLLGQADVGQVLLVIVPGLDQGVLQQLGQRLAGSQVACGAGWEPSSASQSRAVGELHRRADRPGT